MLEMPTACAYRFARESEKEVEAQTTGARTQAPRAIRRRKRTKRFLALSGQSGPRGRGRIESYAEASRSVFLAQRVTGFPSRFALASICRRSVVEKRRE